MPKLLFVVPLSALLVAALSLFFSPPDGIKYARLIGGPTDDPSFFRGRVQLLSETSDVSQPEENAAIDLLVDQGPKSARRRLVTGADGWVEFEVPRQPAFPLDLRIVDEMGRNLAQGSPELSTGRWLAAARRRSFEHPHYNAGPLSAHLEIPFSVLAVPFPATVVVRVESETPDHVEPVEVTVSLEGAELLQAPRCVSEIGGGCVFRVRPLHHQVIMKVRVVGQGEMLEFEERLPIVPGAIALESDSDRSQPGFVNFLVSSPVPRPHIWYAVVSEQGRERGGSLALRDASDGTSSVLLKLDREQARGSYLVLSSDADGRSLSSVGYPLDGQTMTLDAWDAYLLDGAQAARRVAHKRQMRVRYALGGYGLIALVLTLLLFWTSVRRDEKEVDRRLAQVGAGSAQGSRSALSLVVAISCVFFVFSLTLVWIVTR